MRALWTPSAAAAADGATTSPSPPPSSSSSSSPLEQELGALDALPLEDGLLADPAVWRPRSAMALLHAEAERRGLPWLTLLRFCEEGNNIPDGQQLAQALVRAGACGTAGAVRWATPSCWALVSGPLRHSLPAVLTGIYLCNVCSCHEILRRNGLGQGEGSRSDASLWN
jgi:hypothetical protein